jgi:hypothetical protein
VAEHHIGYSIFYVKGAVKTFPVCGRGRVFGYGNKLAVGGVANENLRSTASSVGFAASEKIVFSVELMHLGRPEIAVCPKSVFATVKNYHGAGAEFIQSVFDRFFIDDAVEVFKSIGVEIVFEEDGRAYPMR